MAWTSESDLEDWMMEKLAGLGFAVGSGAETTLTTPGGNPVVWSSWVSENAPVAVLLWASWEPDADKVLADLDSIADAAKSRNLGFVVVAVQEPLEEATESLGSAGVDWLHDRYGRLLKDYRVVSIPRLLILSDDGRVVERLGADPASLKTWGGE